MTIAQSLRAPDDRERKTGLLSSRIAVDGMCCSQTGKVQTEQLQTALSGNLLTISELVLYFRPHKIYKINICEENYKKLHPDDDKTHVNVENETLSGFLARFDRIKSSWHSIS